MSGEKEGRVKRVENVGRVERPTFNPPAADRIKEILNTEENEGKKEEEIVATKKHKRYKKYLATEVTEDTEWQGRNRQNRI